MLRLLAEYYVLVAREHVTGHGDCCSTPSGAKPRPARVKRTIYPWGCQLGSHYLYKTHYYDVVLRTCAGSPAARHQQQRQRLPSHSSVYGSDVVETFRCE